MKADEKYNLPAGYTLLSEIAEASAAFIDARLIAMLHKYNNVIDSIHISDQYVGSQPDQEGQPMKQPETKKMLVVSFFMNEKTDMEELRPLLQLVIYLIGKQTHQTSSKQFLTFNFSFVSDKLKRFKLSREVIRIDIRLLCLV